jgi:hypothetical protein
VKLIPVSKAVGMGLGHDVTEIVPGRFMGWFLNVVMLFSGKM